MDSIQQLAVSAIACAKNIYSLSVLPLYLAYKSNTILLPEKKNCHGESQKLLTEIAFILSMDELFLKGGSLIGGEDFM